MRLKILFFFLVFGFRNYGQITISNSIFFSAGDTIVQNTDNDGAPGKITPVYDSLQKWNFSGLTKQGTRRDSIKGIALNDSNKLVFPSASIIMPFQNFGDEYVAVTGTEVKGLGLTLNFFGMKMAQPYKGSRIIQYAPITYKSSKSSISSIGFGIGVSSIPFLDSLLKQIVPIPGATIDSVRLSLVTKSDFYADAYGLLTTPFETIEVLRVRQENKTSTKIEAKAKVFIFSSWVDISSFLPIALPKDTSVVYHFYSDKAKDPIVTLNLNKSDSVVRASYRSNAAVPVVKDTSKPKDTVKNGLNDWNNQFNDLTFIHFNQQIFFKIPKQILGADIEIMNELGQSILKTKLSNESGWIEIKQAISISNYVKVKLVDRELIKRIQMGWME